MRLPGPWPLLLDGAMGTALIGRGLPPGRPPEEWVLSRPSEVAAVHRSHVAAGAQVLLTCSFNLARLARAGPAGAREIADRAAGLARAAGSVRASGQDRATRAGSSTDRVLVAGCVGATGLAAPGGDGPLDRELEERHEEAFRALAAAGVDLLWAESHLVLREARAAVRAARRTGLPVVAVAVLRPGPGGLEGYDGVPGDEWMEVLWREGAAAVGANCVAPGGALAALVARAAVRVPVPLVVKPSAGLPGAIVPPEPFAAAVEPAVRAGARLVGGCCGATPAHLRALASVVGRCGPASRGGPPARPAAGQARG